MRERGSPVPGAATKRQGAPPRGGGSLPPRRQAVTSAGAPAGGARLPRKRGLSDISADISAPRFLSLY